MQLDDAFIQRLLGMFLEHTLTLAGNRSEDIRLPVSRLLPGEGLVERRVRVRQLAELLVDVHLIRVLVRRDDILVIVILVGITEIEVTGRGVVVVGIVVVV